MSFPLSSSRAWKKFSEAAQAASWKGNTLRVIEAGYLQVDLSAQAYSSGLSNAASELLEQQTFFEARQKLYSGDNVNWTEHRAAWHVALRSSHPPKAIASEILGERNRLRQFVQAADASQQYSSVLHLGTGGSNWGPRMVVKALCQVSKVRRNVFFVSNIDAHALVEAMCNLNPRKTLVVIASKSFTTVETLVNAEIVLDWLRQEGVTNPIEQFAAITDNTKAAVRFGVNPEYIFKSWSWVGGRYSLWSSVGLTVALGLGSGVLDDLRAGAASMDEHFLSAAISVNAPVQMALAGVVNCSVMGYPSHVIVPYDSRLDLLISWAQQLEMESLGKSTTLNGSTAGVPTSPAVWGLPGTDAQHTFFQWLHQDVKGAPVDFIVCARPHHNYKRNHQLLISNCLAQRTALLRGKTLEEALADTQIMDKKVTEDTAIQRNLLAQHCVHPGGRPSTLIVLSHLCPHSLGALLTLYEHKVFVQGVIWGINPFDQWGVEFGKLLARDILSKKSNTYYSHINCDVSTQHWINRLID